MVGRSLAPAWTEYISDWQMDKRTSERTKLRYSMKGRIDSLSRYQQFKGYFERVILHLLESWTKLDASLRFSQELDRFE